MIRRAIVVLVTALAVGCGGISGVALDDTGRVLLVRDGKVYRCALESSGDEIDNCAEITVNVR